MNEMHECNRLLTKLQLSRASSSTQPKNLSGVKTAWNSFHSSVRCTLVIIFSQMKSW